MVLFTYFFFHFTFAPIRIEVFNANDRTWQNLFENELFALGIYIDFDLKMGN